MSTNVMDEGPERLKSFIEDAEVCRPFPISLQASSSSTFSSQRIRIAYLLQHNKFAIAIEVALVVTLELLTQQVNFVTPFAVFLVISGLLWLQNRSWRDFGLTSPVSWRRALGLGLSLAILFIILQLFVLEPLVRLIIHQQPDEHVFSPIQDSPLNLLGAFIAAWTLSAFGEELVFRGYLLTRVSELFGRSRPGWVIAIFAQASLFGYVHGYQGLPGMLITGVYGLFAGVWYLWGRQNLWGNIVAHGLSDSLAYLLIFLG